MRVEWGVPQCIDLLASGAIDVKPIISVKAPLEEGADWFERLYKTGREFDEGGAAAVISLRRLTEFAVSPEVAESRNVCK